MMPRDRVLTETDGPFARIGDGPAYPWDAAAAIPMLAAVWEISADDVAVQIHSNLKSLASMQMV
jgi:TatD DNase family protein